MSTMSFLPRSVNKKYLLWGLIGLCLFIVSVGGTYLIVSNTSSFPTLPSPNTQTENSDIKKTGRIDPNLPRTEICPLNGAKFTKQERDIWEKRRPLAVMIENSSDARPTSGLGAADIVYEAVAEGGITRFMGIYYCGAASDNYTLAPVRSARIYYVRVVPEYDALYNHVGGAGLCNDPTVDERAKALCFISRNKIKDLDQFGLDFKACHRVTNRTDREVAYEHTMACFTDELYTVAEERDWTNVDSKNVAWDKNFVPWKFKADPSASSGQASGQGATNIKFNFWDSQPDYSVEWKYDPASNAYARYNGGEAAVDHNSGLPLTAKNVVIQFVRETGPVDEHKHLLYDVIGTGQMLLFQDGNVVTGTWSKSAATARTKFFGADGKEVVFNPGQIWIEWVPAGNEIEYN